MTHLIDREVLDQILEKHSLWLSDSHDEQLRPTGRRAVLRGMNLQGADLRSVHLDAADLSTAHLCGADLQEANLSYANVNRSNLKDVNLVSADLQWATFVDAILRDANLLGADLQNADFMGADLRGAKFDTNICDCRGFECAHFTPDALPWLILHPRWRDFATTVDIDIEAQ